MYSNKRNLVCSMIMISENATPMTLLQGNESPMQLQEARVSGFSFLNQQWSVTPAQSVQMLENDYK